MEYTPGQVPGVQFKTEEFPLRATPFLLCASIAAIGLAMPALAQPMPDMQMPAEQTPAPPPPEMPEHHHPEASQLARMNMPMGEHVGHEMKMTGALGRYPMVRESSGTAWQPDSTWA